MVLSFSCLKTGNILCQLTPKEFGATTFLWRIRNCVFSSSPSSSWEEKCNWHHTSICLHTDSEVGSPSATEEVSSWIPLPLSCFGGTVGHANQSGYTFLWLKIYSTNGYNTGHYLSSIRIRKKTCHSKDLPTVIKGLFFTVCVPVCWGEELPEMGA